MSNMHTLGVVATSGTTTATMVQGEPNSASGAETSVDWKSTKMTITSQLMKKKIK
jgi:hypothetical protein